MSYDEALYARREQRKVSRIQYTSNTSFQSYIRDAVKEMGRGEAQISKEALIIADDILMDVFNDIAEESRKLMVSSKRRTLMVRDVQAAVKLRFQGEVARHAAAQAARAVISYTERRWGLTDELHWKTDVCRKNSISTYF